MGTVILIIFHLCVVPALYRTLWHRRAECYHLPTTFFVLLVAVQRELHLHQAFRASARSEKYKNDYQSTSQTLHLRRLLSMPIFHAVGVFVDMFVFAQCIAFTREMSCGLPFFALCAQAGALIGVVRWLVSSSAGLAVSGLHARWQYSVVFSHFAAASLCDFACTWAAPCRFAASLASARH